MIVDLIGQRSERNAFLGVKTICRHILSANQRCTAVMTHDDKKPSAKVTAYIDQNLKRVFADLENEPVPDRFQALLDQLRAQEDDPEDKR